MDTFLLNRALGTTSQTQFRIAYTTELFHSLEPQQHLRFDGSVASQAQINSRDEAHRKAVENAGGERRARALGLISPTSGSGNSSTDRSPDIFAHKDGVNTLDLDHKNGRFMVSGGADAGIALWDLEKRTTDLNHTHKPRAALTRGGHRLAHTREISTLSIWPFDPDPRAIITTSADETLKLMALKESSIVPVQTFDLAAKPYSHAVSSIQSMNPTVAVGTSSNAVRLIDLRTGLATQSLLGHAGSVLSVAWSPKHEHVLASASADNRVLLHDIRRGGRGSVFGSLDLDDPIGVLGSRIDSYGGRDALDVNARAHNGPVNAVRWTEDGYYIITAGHDDRVRIWNADKGSNELIHFGPRIRNSRFSEMPLLLPPANTLSRSGGILFWPNDEYKGEVFMLDYTDGKLVKILKTPEPARTVASVSRSATRKKTSGRINALAWRCNGATGAGAEVYSAHGDGKIRAWGSRTQEDVDQEQLEKDDIDLIDIDKKRKRDVLDEISAGLTGREIRFT